MERRLSAIFAIDMVGYSRLIEADEVGTLERQKNHRHELIDPAFQEFHGRIVKEMGDGLLVEFPSVVEAVQCAVAIQRAMHDRGANIPEDHRVTYRVGINLGDIIVEGDDIHGDGVNVAARLEAMAEPGGICISGAAYDQMRSTVKVGYEALGDVQVKNIERPIRAYRVLMGTADAGTVIEKSRRRIGPRMWVAMAAVLLLAIGAGGWWAQRPDFEPADPEKLAIAIPDEPSIAVLPFDNMSADPEQEYFVDGLTDDLITRLANVSGLFVIARNSVFTYKDKNEKVEVVARDLGVRFVLEGSVRRAGGKIRINAQLIDATTGGHLWAEIFDRDTTDVFALQDQVTAKITESLRVILTPSERKAIVAHGTRNVEAFDMFLRGMRYLSDRKAFDHDGNLRAVEQFERALELDPNYAQALAGIAWAKWLYHSTINVFEQNYKLDAFKYAEQSLELEDNALAHRILARRYYSPSLHITTTGEPQRAVEELEAALSLEPSNPDLLADLADALPFTGQRTKALETIMHAIRINPDYPRWYLRPLGIAQLLDGDAPGAAKSLQEWLDTEQLMGEYTLWLGSALALSGRADEARHLFENMRFGGQGSLPITEYAVRRKWPLSEGDANTLIEGLRLAGFPEVLEGEPPRN